VRPKMLTLSRDVEEQRRTSWRLCPTIAHHPVPGRTKTLRSLHSTAEHQELCSCTGADAQSDKSLKAVYSGPACSGHVAMIFSRYGR
jgi:hypothetical protein